MFWVAVLIGFGGSFDMPGIVVLISLSGPFETPGVVVLLSFGGSFETYGVVVLLSLCLLYPELFWVVVSALAVHSTHAKPTVASRPSYPRKLAKPCLTKFNPLPLYRYLLPLLFQRLTHCI